MKAKAVSRLLPRFQPRCWAHVVMVPFPRTGNVGKGPGVGERCWLQSVLFEDGWPVTGPGGDIKEAAQCGL